MQVAGMLIKALPVKPKLKLLVLLHNHLNNMYEDFYFFYYVQRVKMCHFLRLEVNPLRPSIYSSHK